ncbi:hypothetical protein SUGI_0182610 [Cryptomeria japonica]|nr:hypothetical protein SUGI_0182610 [Cryptomeria japonica]
MVMAIKKFLGLCKNLGRFGNYGGQSFTSRNIFGRQKEWKAKSTFRALVDRFTIGVVSRCGGPSFLALWRKRNRTVGEFFAKEWKPKDQTTTKETKKGWMKFDGGIRKINIPFPIDEDTGSENEVMDEGT